MSEEECGRTTERNGYYAIAPMLPELRPQARAGVGLDGEYSSASVTLDVEGVRQLIDRGLSAE